MRKYARLLGPRLRRDYGASEHYTIGQISAAVKKCGLPLGHIAFGYAAFLPEETFKQTAGGVGDYQSLRRFYQRYVRTSSQFPFENIPGVSTGPNSSVLGDHDLSGHC